MKTSPFDKSQADKFKEIAREPEAGRGRTPLWLRKVAKGGAGNEGATFKRGKDPELRISKVRASNASYHTQTLPVADQAIRARSASQTLIERVCKP